MGNFGPKMVKNPSPPPNFQPAIEEYILIAQTQPELERYRIVRHAPEIVDGKYLLKTTLFGILMSGLFFASYVSYATKHGAHFPARVMNREWKKTEEERSILEGEYVIQSYNPSRPPEVINVQVDAEENK